MIKVIDKHVVVSDTSHYAKSPRKSSPWQMPQYYPQDLINLQFQMSSLNIFIIIWEI